MNNITVIGSGTMGNGIAHCFAQNHFNVNLVDISEDKLKNALSVINKNLDRQKARSVLNAEQKANVLARIKTSTNLKKSTEYADLAYRHWYRPV